MRNKQDITVFPDIPLLMSLRRGAIYMPLFPENSLSSSDYPLPILLYFMLIQGKIREYRRRESAQLLRDKKQTGYNSSSGKSRTGRHHDDLTPAEFRNDVGHVIRKLCYACIR
jgi:hypothetical protein